MSTSSRLVEDRQAKLHAVLTKLRKVSLQGEVARQKIDEASAVLLSLWREQKELMREANRLIGIESRASAPVVPNPGLVERLPGMFVESTRLPLLRSSVTTTEGSASGRSAPSRKAPSN
jgi:hypothetical protein